MTKKEEVYLLKSFKESYPKFPEGKVIYTDSPDVIVENLGHRIGIELTEIFQDSFLKSSKVKEIESYHYKTAMIFLNKIQNIVSFKFALYMDYNDVYIQLDSSETITEQCAEICLPHVAKLKNGEPFYMNDTELLPKQIRRIAIARFDALSNSYYGKNEGGIVPDLTYMHLERVLEEKEQKITKYQACDEQWLLIKEGNYFAVHFQKYY